MWSNQTCGEDDPDGPARCMSYDRGVMAFILVEFALTVVLP